MQLNKYLIGIASCIALQSSLTAPCLAQTEVEPFVPGSTLDGVNYFLPRTALRMVVEVEKTVVTPGELNKYAFRYMRLNDVPTEPRTTYAIKGITLQPYGVIDSRKAISIKVRSKTLAPLVTLSHDGILLSVNKEVQQPRMADVPANVPAATAADPRDFMTQEMLAANSTAKLAELCAQEIYDIRESRNELIRGEADNTPKDGAQLQLMLSQLDQQARALESLFKGTTSSSTEYRVINAIPEEEGEAILFRFSRQLGIVEADDLAGEPIYLSLTPTGKLPARVDDPETARKKARQEKGLYYNVPVRQSVKVYDTSRTFVQQEYPMAQFGTTEILSDVLFNKNTTLKVSFFPETGAIEKLEQ